MVIYLILIIVANIAGGMVMLRRLKAFSLTFHGILFSATIFVYFAVDKMSFTYDSSLGSKPFAPCAMFRSLKSFFYEVVFVPLSSLILMFGFTCGLAAAVKSGKLPYHEFRYRIVSPFWVALHAQLLSTKGLYPSPAHGADDKVEEIDFTQYKVMHPNASPLSVPAATSVPYAQRFKYNPIGKTLTILLP